MGAAIHRVDFLYPTRNRPEWAQHGPYAAEHHPLPIKQQPPQSAEEPKTEKTLKVNNQLYYRSTYDDYSDYSSIMGRSQLQPMGQSKGGSHVEVEKKILLLPASEEGPIMLNIHKSIDEDLKVKSYIEIKSNRNSRLTERKSSIISLNSNESKTVIVKRQLQPSIREILDDTPPKGQCYTFMQKGKQAWKIQNYPKCIQYLQNGLAACEVQHPLNYYEKGIYHRRLGANYRMLYNDDQALKHFEQSLKYFQVDPETQIIEIASVLNNIGIIYQEEHKFEIALEKFNRSLELKRQFLPEHHEELALRLNNIGLLQWTIGEQKKAIDSYAQALHINKIVYGYNHHEVAKNYYDLSLCLFGVGEYGLWLDYHYESLKIMKKIGLIQTLDYKNWMNCFKIRMRQFLAIKGHQQQLVIKSLGMMALILEKDDQIQFMNEIKDDLQKF